MIVKVGKNMYSKYKEKIETIKKVKKHIEGCLRRFIYFNNESKLCNKDMDYWNEKYFQRIDELFILWGKLRNISFAKSVEEFGLNYSDFNDRNYKKIFYQLSFLFPNIL
jgi:hypothetical protein